MRSGKVSVYISVLVVGAGREPVDAPGGVCCRQGSVLVVEAGTGR